MPTGASGPGQPALPAITAEDKLAWELQTIAAFVGAGNNLFVECLGIQAMEGLRGKDNVNGPYGIPATRFQTTNGILDWNGPSSVQSLLDPMNPDVQVGDFQYSLVYGAVTTYSPSNSVSPPASAYRPGATVLIDSVIPTATPAWNVSSVIQVDGSGTVAYLGGHDYSPTADIDSNGNPVSTPSAHHTPGQTAGTRVVLNTLLNLGFSCAVRAQ
jgi:hypothetical protein